MDGPLEVVVNGVTNVESAWAQDEVASVDLNDERLNSRAVVLLSSLGNRPNLSIPSACGGRAEMEAAYRFFDNEKVSFDKLLEPHTQRTLERLEEQPVVLMVNDTTEIELMRPQQQVEGVGQLSDSRQGVLLHVLHAFTPDGTPQGTVAAQCLNRVEGVSDAPKAQKEQSRKHKPIEQKESMRWLTALRAAREAARKLLQSLCIYIGDSEADIYELFCEPRDIGQGREIHWLIRACQNRALKHEGKPQGESEHQYLREQALASPPLYELELQIRGREAKTGVEKRARRKGRDSRCAKVEVRATTVTLRPPWRSDRKLSPVSVNVVLVRECNPPAGEEAVEWILVTTLPIETLEQVRRVVEYYCVRWNIEILFRTLKSGCRIEQRRFEHVDRIVRCMGLYLIVAWRTLFVCRSGRECPDADCETIFEPSEWKATWVAVHQKKPPKKRPRLREMVHLIARLGGYVERPSSEPGPQTVWIGLQRMYDLAWAWDTFGPAARLRAG
jgi:hypothetical protein